ncbi:FtsW/RodA/SpoVE family cell cycle protein, partial [Patescibacteria group bacterium]|nr:FtsW/RodA/SpoVE family cell cycle protein [Patescibacteria group bacterium]
KMSPYIFIIGIILTLLVFSPLGFSHGGAQRWISLGFISFQPAELLKFSSILFIASWFAHYKDKVREWKYGILAFMAFMVLSLLPLALQPDSGTLVLIGCVAFIIYWMRGAPWKHILITVILGGVAIGGYVFMNPHIIDRIQTFRDPNQDPYGSSYQIRQSRIAIGSGKLYGRGLGQSVHKFGPYLPESNSDSIFAIFAEEYGFVGSVILISLYGLFGFFGFRVARHAPNAFAQNLVVGIILLIVIQVFFNIAAISGIVPLSGLPLIFMSNGGTALIVTLAQLGIVLNISQYTTKPNTPRTRV